MYSGKHEQDPAPLRSLHTALAPHGDGEHGVIISWGGAEMAKWVCHYVTWVLGLVIKLMDGVLDFL